MTAPLSPQKIAALWRAYKQRQSAHYVASCCKVSPHTAQKYIRERKFADRFAKLQARANQIVDEDEALALATDIATVANLKSRLGQAILALLDEDKLVPNTADFDRMVRLERFLRGEPDSRTKHTLDFEWLEELDGEREQ